MLEKLKKKWEIKSDFRMIVILFVFALSGSSTLFFRKGIFHLFGITAETSLLIKIPLYILIIVPSYQLMFLIIGTLFGQFKFVWKFEKKMLSRFKFKK